MDIKRKRKDLSIAVFILCFNLCVSRKLDSFWTPNVDCSSTSQDPCVLLPTICEPGGLCVAQGCTYKCVCQGGFEGSDCHSAALPSPSSPVLHTTNSGGNAHANQLDIFVGNGALNFLDNLLKDSTPEPENIATTTVTTLSVTKVNVIAKNATSQNVSTPENITSNTTIVPTTMTSLINNSLVHSVQQGVIMPTVPVMGSAQRLVQSNSTVLETNATHDITISKPTTTTEASPIEHTTSTSNTSSDTGTTQNRIKQDESNYEISNSSISTMNITSPPEELTTAAESPVTETTLSPIRTTTITFSAPTTTIQDSSATSTTAAPTTSTSSSTTTMATTTRKPTTVQPEAPVTQHQTPDTTVSNTMTIDEIMSALTSLSGIMSQTKLPSIPATSVTLKPTILEEQTTYKTTSTDSTTTNLSPISDGTIMSGAAAQNVNVKSGQVSISEAGEPLDITTPYIPISPSSTVSPSSTFSPEFHAVRRTHVSGGTSKRRRKGISFADHDYHQRTNTPDDIPYQRDNDNTLSATDNLEKYEPIVKDNSEKELYTSAPIDSLESLTTNDPQSHETTSNSLISRSVDKQPDLQNQPVDDNNDNNSTEDLSDDVISSTTENQRSTTVDTHYVTHGGNSDTDDPQHETSVTQSVSTSSPLDDDATISTDYFSSISITEQAWSSPSSNSTPLNGASDGHLANMTKKRRKRSTKEFLKTLLRGHFLKKVSRLIV